MPKAVILVVEDDDDIRHLIKFNLEKAGYDIIECGNGETAIEVARARLPDLVVLDLMLPGIDGHQVCFQLKSDPALKHIPVVMVTARVEETDVVIGLGVGADDYVAKPFSPRVLVARIQAVLRRRAGTTEAPPEAPSVALSWLSIEPARHEVRVAGAPVRLTPIEFKILYFLARHPGYVFGRMRIIDEAQGEDVTITERTVDVHVASLRKKLGGHGDHIETVRGVGYKFTDP